MKSYQPLLLESEWKKPDLTASDLTSFALELFRIWKWRVRRVNNIPSNKGYKNHIQKGWSDIQGYTGPIKYTFNHEPPALIVSLPVLCEVKKRGDKMKQEQYDRLMDCHECGGEAWVCHQDDKGNAQLIKFIYYAKNHKPIKK